MIWEVDDDCDKCVNWPEFQAMYHRCRNDKTGYEPRRLYNVVEFLVNDKDDSGSVSVEEATQILYLRHELIPLYLVAYLLNIMQILALQLIHFHLVFFPISKIDLKLTFLPLKLTLLNRLVET